MPKGGGRGPYVVLGLVSALAVGAIGFVHYDQQKQRQVVIVWWWRLGGWVQSLGVVVGCESK